MLKAIDVANYIVWYANENHKDYSVTPLKLQKILYYISVVYARKNNSMPFAESFRKWQFGPVVPEVYDSFKSYGASPITQPLTYVDLDFEAEGINYKTIDFDLNMYLKEFRQLVDGVIDELIPVPPFELVEMTHKDKAWLVNKSDILNGDKSLSYTLEDIISSDYPYNK